MNAGTSLQPLRPQGVPAQPPDVSGGRITDPGTKEQLVAFIAFHYLSESGQIQWQRAFTERPEWEAALGVNWRNAKCRGRLYDYTHRLLRRLGRGEVLEPAEAPHAQTNGPSEALRTGHREDTQPQRVILWPHFCWNCGNTLVAPAWRVAHCCSQCGSSQTEIAEAINRTYAQKTQTTKEY